MVDEKGQALETSGDTPSPAPIEAKSLTLPPIAWPGHALRSVRTVELSRADDGWTVVRSYIGPTPQ